MFSSLGLGLVAAAAAAAFPRRDPSTAAFPHFGGDRKVYTLTGDWDFQFINKTDYNASLPLDLKALKFGSSQAVPGAWDSRWGTGLQYSRGAGVYRSTLPVGPGEKATLRFESCSLFCRVYVDGELLHNSTLGGFTPFEVAIPVSHAPAAPTDPAGGSDENPFKGRSLVVMASNVFDRELTPTQQANYDFYQYGGLLREVTLHVHPAAATATIRRVTVNPLGTAAKPDVPSGKVEVGVVLDDVPGSSVVLGLCWDVGATAPPAPTCAAAKSYKVTKDGTGWMVSISSVAVPRYKVWDPNQKKPALHTLTVTLTTSLAEAARPGGVAATTADSCQVRFGIRIVSRSGRSILVNGKKTKLHGYNRHDMFPQFGPTMPSALYDADLELLQGPHLNGNFIRGSHYPQDPRFLDRCDERGVLVWEEALAWGNYGNQLTDPWFLANQVGTANAMLDRDTNHPSIILWGFFNEGQTDKNTSCPAYQTMASTFKGRDPSRLVTWADNRGPSSLCLEYADVVSFNYYPGWYNGPAEGIFSTWADRGAWVAQHYPDKPFIISETGAGGILGDHNRSATNSSEPARWSLEYQVVVDRDDAMVAMVSENITGISLWQFCDIKVDQSNTSTGRPGGINNKGVVSQYRDPKPAAAAVAKAYTKAV